MLSNLTKLQQQIKNNYLSSSPSIIISWSSNNNKIYHKSNIKLIGKKSYRGVS